MLAILSPAKSLDFSPHSKKLKQTTPLFTEDTDSLIQELQKITVDDMAKLMKISAALSHLNFERNQTFNNIDTPQKEALLAFTGEAYRGLSADTLTDQQLNRADKKLRILSGLYGILRPLDLIKPYRLEMGTQLQNVRGKNLYEFWKQKVTDQLNADLSENGKILVNVASNEYSKVIDRNKIDAKVIDIDFLQECDGTYKNISVYSKKARGMMVRFMIDETIKSAKNLQAFDMERYNFNVKLSTPNKYVFTRQYC